MLNIRETEEQKIYITSDTHLGHQREFIWEDRGYENSKQHDDSMIRILNETVRATDILIHLGDFCLNTSPSQFEEFLSRINCQNIYMLWGNHPNPHYKNVYIPLLKRYLGNLYKDDMELYPLRYRNVVYFGHYAEMVLNGQFMVLCHYPIYIFNEMQHGAWMLCGHSHNGCSLSKVDTEEGRILDVGWDGHSKPWSFLEIKKLMDTKRFVANDEHHQDKQQNKML